MLPPAERERQTGIMEYVRKLEDRCRAHRLRRARWFVSGFLVGALVAAVLYRYGGF